MPQAYEKATNYPKELKAGTQGDICTHNAYSSIIHIS